MNICPIPFNSLKFSLSSIFCYSFLRQIELFLLPLHPKSHIKHNMNTRETTYKKEPVRLQLRQRAGGKQVVYLEFYKEGVRTYERIPDMVIVPETDHKAIKAHQTVLAKAEKICRQRKREVLKAQKQHTLVVESEDEGHRLSLMDWIGRFETIQKSRGIRDLNGIHSLRRYLSLYKDEEIALEDVDIPYCLGFISFLKTGYKTKDGKQLSGKTGFNVLGELRTSLNVAVSEGMIRTNPITKLNASEKIIPKETVREYLTIAEVKRLIDTPCDKDIVKRAFLFSCNCGLRRGDILSLRWKDITFDDGAWRVCTRMKKTANMVYISLPKQAMRWLECNPGERDSEELVFAGLSAGTISDQLSAWVEKAGIKGKHVTFHVARHTYATMLITLGVDLYTVSKLLGHSSIRHTQRYAKIIDSVKDRTVGLMDEMIP